MARFATLALLLALVAGPAGAQTVTRTPIATGAVTTAVYDNGILHGDCNTSATPWFRFGTTDAGCGAGFLVGLSSTNVIGDAYITTAATGWTPVSSGASTSFPYPTLTQGVRTTFTNGASGLFVVANHYWAANSPYIVHRYEVTNSGTTPIANAYMGMFYDYDVAETATPNNLGSYTAGSQLLSVRNGTNAALPHFGVAALTGTVSGYSYDTPYPAAAGQQQDRAALYAGLTVTQGTTSAARDQRGVLGVGPYNLAAGATVTVVFTSVAGANQAGIITNTNAARTAIGATAGEAGPEAAGLALRAAVPNPATTSAALTFELAEAQAVRLVVTDVLGREVAVAVDGVQTAGEHTVRLSTAELPAGVYVARLTAGASSVTRRFSVAH